jgi:predicted transcriptional regulator
MNEENRKMLLNYLTEPRTFEDIQRIFPNKSIADVSDYLWELKAHGLIEAYDRVYAATPQVPFKDILAKIKARDNGDKGRQQVA